VNAVAVEGHRAACAAMATRFELVLEGGSRAALRSAAEAAIEVIEECASRWTRFERAGWPARIARAEPGAALRIDAEDAELLAIALDAHAATDGAFDPSLGAGFDVQLDAPARTLTPRRSGVALDFGAIAKGHALELAARVLHEHGVASAFLHGGTSSALALGPRAWRVQIGVDGPCVELKGRALSVSAQRGRAHVLNPRSAKAAESPATAVALHGDARVAEAWSTALLVAGPELSQRSRPAGLELVLIPA
jgi:FAD:protein FMN transferase